MKIILSNRSGVPIYEQIKEQIKESIFSGSLHEGDLLPSIRNLAKDLTISVITTTRAYNDLQEEGFIANVQGKGCYVLPQNSGLVRESALKKIEDSLTSAITFAKTAGISKNEIFEILALLCKEDHYE